MILSVISVAQQYTFQKIGLEEGIPSSRINDFLEDSRGYFWIGTEGAGLVRYDGFNFKTIDFGKESIKPVITALAEDPSGNIWLAAENTLVKYTGKSQKFYYLPDRQERIIDITFDAKGEALVAIPGGVFRINGGDTLAPEAVTIQGRIKGIQSFQDELWIASDKGLYQNGRQIQEGRWHTILVAEGSLIAQGPDSYFHSTILNPGNWAGEHLFVRDGMSVVIRRDSLILMSESETRYLNAENGLPQEDFKGCYLDRTGVVWLFSNSGLTKLPGTAFQLYDVMQSAVMGVLNDGNRLLAGTDEGLFIIDQSRVQKSSPAEYNYGVILAIARFGGYDWLGTESGLVRFDGRRFQKVSLSGDIGDFVFALKATDDALWIGTGSGIFNYRNGRINDVSTEEELPFASVYAISEAMDGSLWFATYTQGFFRFHDGAWDNLREMAGIRLDSLRYNSFTAVNENELWLGTPSEGILHLGDNYSEGIDHANLGFAETRSMITDDRGRLWLGTNKGVYLITHDENGLSATFLNQSQQLIEDGCSPQAIDFHNGMLVVGAGNGLLRIDIDELERKRPDPVLALTEVQLFFGDVEGLEDYGDGVMAFTGVPVNLKLPNSLNYISFTLAGLSGYGPDDLEYRYRLKQSDNWTQAGTRREAVFSNLPPDNYVFQAQVRRPGEEWREEFLSYPFRIKPPVWQQWWFIVIAILLIGTGSYWYIRQRIARANQRLILENSLLEMERKALRLQMNPHFIFNALDSISSFIFKKNPEQAVRYLNNFAKLMRLTLESSMEHLHPVETEVSILKNYLELEKLRFQGKLDYEIELDDEIDYDVGIPPMLIQPHVENAILHGIKPKEGGGKVMIRFNLDDELLICEIEDDGIGRKASKELPIRKDHRSMATEINKGRLELLRRSLGEKVEIKIIDKENPTGTLVIIKLPAEHY